MKLPGLRPKVSEKVMFSGQREELSIQDESKKLRFGLDFEAMTSASSVVRTRRPIHEQLHSATRPLEPPESLGKIQQFAPAECTLSQCSSSGCMLKKGGCHFKSEDVAEVLQSSWFGMQSISPVEPTLNAQNGSDFVSELCVVRDCKADELSVDLEHSAKSAKLDSWPILT